jgi:hypothetical protein
MYNSMLAQLNSEPGVFTKNFGKTPKLVYILMRLMQCAPAIRAIMRALCSRLGIAGLIRE